MSGDKWSAFALDEWGNSVNSGTGDKMKVQVTNDQSMSSYYKQPDKPKVQILKRVPVVKSDDGDLNKTKLQENAKGNESDNGQEKELHDSYNEKLAEYTRRKKQIFDRG